MYLIFPERSRGFSLMELNLLYGGDFARFIGFSGDRSYAGIEKR
jgi:hypothetical protein